MAEKKLKLQVNATSSTCRMCGTAYGKLNGYFYKCYGQLYKGVGYLPYCKDCVDSIFNTLYKECGDEKSACRQMCMKFNLYWNEALFERANSDSSKRTLFSSYITKLNIVRYTGMSYEDTLREEGRLFDYGKTQGEPSEKETVEEDIEIPDDVIEFWGPGYTPQMYQELEGRKQYWTKQLPKDFDFTAGSLSIIRQICFMELDINKFRTLGQPVDKLVGTLNSLIGSLNLKPSQNKDKSLDEALSSTPLGVWLYRYENERPLPEVPHTNEIRKTVFTWMGHVCKMLGKKNAYTELYEKEINRLRVERPEYDDEDDEAFMMDIITEDDWGDAT